MENVEILPNDFPKFDFPFKIIIIGDSNTGKSCISIRATRKLFEQVYVPTVGFEFFAFSTRINNKVIKLQIWDTCGQETYRSLISSFYKNSSLAILIYSIDNKESFNHIENWLNDFRKHNPNAKIILVGNKSDLEESRVVSKDEGENFAKANKLDLFFETSAKSGYNAQKVFIEATKLLYPEFLEKKKEEEKKKGEEEDEEDSEEKEKNN